MNTHPEPEESAHMWDDLSPRAQKIAGAIIIGFFVLGIAAGIGGIITCIVHH